MEEKKTHSKLSGTPEGLKYSGEPNQSQYIQYNLYTKPVSPVMQPPLLLV